VAIRDVRQGDANRGGGQQTSHPAGIEAATHRFRTGVLQRGLAEKVQGKCKGEIYSSMIFAS
jgi:hypothetical protein